MESQKPYVGGSVLLGDIINVTGLDTTTGMLAEIKTPDEAAEGELKLQQYLTVYNDARPFDKTWIRDYFWGPSVKQFWLGAANPAFANTFGIIIGNANGVITYTTYTADVPHISR